LGRFVKYGGTSTLWLVHTGVEFDGDKMSATFCWRQKVDDATLTPNVDETLWEHRMHAVILMNEGYWGQGEWNRKP